MGVFGQPDGPTREALKRLSVGLLRGSGRSGVRGNLLEVRHPAAPLFDPTFLHSASEAFGLSISLSQDGRAGNGQRVCCDAAQLPFQDGLKHPFSIPPSRWPTFTNLRKKPGGFQRVLPTAEIAFGCARQWAILAAGVFG